MKIKLMGVVLLSVLTTACATQQQENSDGKNEEVISTPNGMTFSIQCQQSNLLDFFTGDVGECHPALAPVWHEDPDEVFKRKGHGG